MESAKTAFGGKSSSKAKFHEILRESSSLISHKRAMNIKLTTQHISHISN